MNNAEPDINSGVFAFSTTACVAMMRTYSNKYCKWFIFIQTNCIEKFAVCQQELEKKEQGLRDKPGNKYLKNAIKRSRLNLRKETNLQSRKSANEFVKAAKIRESNCENREMPRINPKKPRINHENPQKTTTNHYILLDCNIHVQIRKYKRYKIHKISSQLHPSIFKRHHNHPQLLSIFLNFS